MQDGRQNEINNINAPENQSSKQQTSKVQFRPNRIFVLDTNVLLHDSKAMFAFKGVVVGIPFVVLQELDTFKENGGEKGRNVREAIRTLDELRSRGCLSEGVALNHETQAILKVLPTPAYNAAQEPYGDIVDDLIIKTVQNLVEQNFKATLVTKDINARVKADALGLDAEDYTKDIVTSDKFYKGWITTSLPSGELQKIGASSLPELLFQKNIEIEKLTPNEFVVVESEKNPENYRLFRFWGGKTFKEVTNIKLIGHFGAKNVQQLMALDLLRDDNVKIISLLGPAGTGKTFLTLLVGLQKVSKERLYRKFLITKPVIALGADIGYLPGEMQEKLHYWMQPVHDNLELIFDQINKADQETISPTNDKWSKSKHKFVTESPVDILQEKGILSLEAITYMRGRSIPYQFVFIDEVQNLNPHEVKTIVSRAGEGTKIILAGDPFQIDSPYLDFSSNGLTVTTKKFKGQQIFGTVFLEKSERSELAKLAASIL